MRTLPFLLLSSCLVTKSDLSTVEEDKCEQEIKALEDSCLSQSGIFRKEVDKARKCLGDKVRIQCFQGDILEPNILTITK